MITKQYFMSFKKDGHYTIKDKTFKSEYSFNQYISLMENFGYKLISIN